MKRQEFVDIAKKIATDISTKYQLGGWGQQNGNTYLFDCVCLIKSILWGFNFSKGGHGGAVYCSNGVPDLAANDFFKQCCYNISNNFSKIEPGEIVYLDGHVGIYVGNNRVVEATSAWDNKVLISSIDYEGRRTYNYTQIYNWTSHGKCKYIDYSSSYKYKVGDLVILNGWTHSSSKSGSETTGEYHDFVWTISKVECGEYPYNVNNVGWCREKYLTPYNSEEYKQLYEKELLKTKDLEKQLDNLKVRINKAIENLKDQD